MDVQLLRRAMQETYVDDATLRAYLPHFEAAMDAAEITTVRRAAMWCAQLGHESAGLRYMAEIQTSGPDWSWDRTRYRGRGPIQLTWSSNYRAFGQWCQAKGFVTDADLFVNQPELVEQPRWGFLAASWYWIAARPQINAMCDAGDIEGVTRAINGGLNGYDDRRARYQRCLALGDALLPTGDVMAALDPNQQNEMYLNLKQNGPAQGSVRKAPRWLARFLPKSFRIWATDPKSGALYDTGESSDSPWPNDMWAAITNEVVTGTFDLVTPIDFGDGNGPIKLTDVPPTQPVNFVTLLRIIGARQAKSLGLIK